MNILYLCHRFPYPPKRGGKIRPFNMIRHLQATGHQVTVCSLARSSAEAMEGHGIKPHCGAYYMGHVSEPVQYLRMIARLPLVTPSSMGYFYSGELAARVRKLLRRQHYDLIFVHCSSVAQYVEHVDDTPKILDFGDMDSQKWLEYANYKPFPLSLGYTFEGHKMLWAEKRLARRFDLCTATTRAEWQTLEDYGTGAATDWFPNGVDADFFCPDPRTGGAYDTDTVSFIGRMDYYPNQECMLRFCKEVWPILRRERGTMKLVIVGADPSPKILALGTMPGITVTGSVVDVRPYIR
ncbi:MAG: TIGR03087 family PEP-CTERM/XrtA system glycosyltransferase, partial [Rubrivivax sp.]|nr:TIGR03087 family PEP-CTERM/XrtA system glycosyltransferase [Rubrivivax sp.]